MTFEPGNQRRQSGLRRGVAGAAPRRGGVFLAALFFAAFLAGAAVLAWMLFLPRWVERVVEERTGYPITVGFLGCNPLGFLLQAEGVRIGSPDAFAERGFMVVSSLRWEMDVSSLGKEVAVARDVEIRLERLVVGLDEKGESNLERFFESLKLPKMRIRRARLVVEEVTLADDSGLRPQRRSYRANIDETLEDLSSPMQIFEPVFIDAIRLGFPRLLGEGESVFSDEKVAAVASPRGGDQASEREKRPKKGLDLAENLFESARLR